MSNKLSAETDEVIEEMSRGKRRHDTALPESKAEAAPGEPARRHDSVPEDELPPIDGYGEPFHIECNPGYKIAWVSDFDRRRLGWRRWRQALWGDPEIKNYHGADVDQKKGTPIVFGDLTAYVMTEENAAKDAARDPRRRAHNTQRASLFDRARTSGAYDPVTKAPIPNPTLGFVTPHQFGGR